MHLYCRRGETVVRFKCVCASVSDTSSSWSLQIHEAAWRLLVNMRTDTMCPLWVAGYYRCFIVHDGRQNCSFRRFFFFFSSNCTLKKITRGTKSKSILSGNIQVIAGMYPAVLWLFWLLLYKKKLFHFKRASYNCLSGKPARRWEANQPQTTARGPTW